MPQALDGSTICAISTAPGGGGIAVVRVSGPKALDISSAIFSKISLATTIEASFLEELSTVTTSLTKGLLLFYVAPDHTQVKTLLNSIFTDPPSFKKR